MSSFSFKTLIRRIILGLCVVVLLGFVSVVLYRWFMQTKPIRYGITFSTIYSKELGLDYQKTFQHFVEELGVRYVRLPVYWYEVEPKNNQFDWSKIDWIVNYSQNHGLKLTMVVGSKVPRWPECFVPNWASSLHADDQQKEVLELIQTTINRYKSFDTIERWQVENEPYFPFGVCEQIREKDLNARIALVRSLDLRPIQMTVSGEMEPWGDLKNKTDILGVSMYRKTWNKLFGYFVYPFTPEFYRWRFMLAKPFFQKVIVSELQAEPWFPESIKSQSLSYWYSTFDATAFEDNIRFIEQTHAEEVYLWGAEWWEYMRVNGDGRLWDVARDLFEKSRFRK